MEASCSEPNQTLRLVSQQITTTLDYKRETFFTGQIPKLGGPKRLAFLAIGVGGFCEIQKDRRQSKQGWCSWQNL
jgi:hypothetical protein